MAGYGNASPTVTDPAVAAATIGRLWEMGDGSGDHDRVFDRYIRSWRKDRQIFSPKRRTRLLAQMDAPLHFDEVEPYLLLKPESDEDPAKTRDTATELSRTLGLDDKEQDEEQQAGVSSPSKVARASPLPWGRDSGGVGWADDEEEEEVETTEQMEQPLSAEEEAEQLELEAQESEWGDYIAERKAFLKRMEELRQIEKEKADKARREAKLI